MFLLLNYKITIYIFIFIHYIFSDNILLNIFYALYFDYLNKIIVIIFGICIIIAIILFS